MIDQVTKYCFIELWFNSIYLIQFQGPGIGLAGLPSHCQGFLGHECMRDMVNVISYTCLFPMTSQNMCCETVCCLMFFSLQYAFNSEKLVLGGQQPTCEAPSCPPYWLMFSSPQESHRTNRRSSDLWAPSFRPRSHSLNSADARSLRHRTVKFLISDSDSEDEDGYFEDNECSSTEDAPHITKSRERPRSAAPKDPLSRVKDMYRGPSPHHCKPDSPVSLRGHRGNLSSPQDCRQPLRALEQRRQQASPLPHGQKNGKKRQRPPVSVGRKYSQNTPPAGPSPSNLHKPRPSSAGPVVKNHRQKVFFCQYLKNI